MFAVFKRIFGGILAGWLMTLAAKYHITVPADDVESVANWIAVIVVALGAVAVDTLAPKLLDAVKAKVKAMTGGNPPAALLACLLLPLMLLGCSNASPPPPVQPRRPGV